LHSGAGVKTMRFASGLIGLVLLVLGACGEDDKNIIDECGPLGGCVEGFSCDLRTNTCKPSGALPDAPPVATGLEVEPRD